MSQAIAISHVSSFAPTDLGGCVMDLDPDVACIVDGSAKVQQLTDLSGAGNHATQGTPTTRPAFNVNPLNGRRTITFAGAQALTHPLSLAIGTFAVVARRTGAAAGYQAIAKWGAGGTSGTYLYAASGSGNTWGAYCNADVSSSYTITSWRVCAAVVRAANDIDLWTDGTKETRTNGASLYGGSARMIGADGTSQYFTGDLARLIAYSAPKADADVQRLCRALGRRYGLAVA